MKLAFNLSLTVAAMLPCFSFANGTNVLERVDVQLDPTTVRNIGGVKDFNREQFITIHESFGSSDMNEEDLRYIEEVMEAEYGRDGGTISWIAEGVKADPKNPDMPNVAQIKDVVERKLKGESDFRWKNENMRNVILCTHPEIMHGFAQNKAMEWGPRTPEATAEFTAQLLKNGFTKKNRPKFLEVYNEPFVKANKIFDGAKKEDVVGQMCEQHNVVAKRVKELTPDVMVGGYSAAWVEVESRNFGHWNDWQKRFMDIAGENMDFWSYHIYDGVNVTGTPRSRTGSNSEAIMDLVDSYSAIKFGVAKPIMITEYGKIPGGNMNTMPYSAERSAGMLYSAMGQLMTYMDHPDRLLRTVPFFLGKASWTYGMKNEWVPGTANPFLMWRKTADGSFIETDLMKFYYFWKGVEGEWRKSSSSNPDVRVQFLAEDDELNVILMNLDDEAKEVYLNGLKGVKAESISIRSLTTNCERPILGERPTDKIPASIEMEEGDVVMIQIELDDDINPTKEIQEHRVYATEYLKDIVANKEISFDFENVPTGNGSAILRLSPGRELGKQPLPNRVSINGVDLKIPTNWAGDDQAGRANFFGMVEFEVPMSALQKNSTVKMVFPDSGGKVASAVLQVNVEE